MTNQYFTGPQTLAVGANLWRRPQRAAFEVVFSSAEGTTGISPGRTARLAHAVAPRLSNTAASELASQICDCRRCPTVKGKGLSLLEVVLALAILAFATAYLSQSMQLAVQNAIRAERLTQAELVAESVMNQVIAGVIPSDPVTWTSYQNSSGVTDWMYQLQTVPTEVDGMIGLQVAVQKIDPAIGLVQTNFDLYANRWIIDPTLELDIPPATEEEVDSTGATSSSSAAGPPSAGSGTGAASQPANAGTIGGVGGGGFGGGGFGGGAGGGRGGAGGQGGAGGGRGGAAGPGAAGPGGGRPSAAGTGGGRPGPAGGQNGGGPGGRGGAGGGGRGGGAPGGGFSPGGPGGGAGGGAGFGGGGAGGGGFAPGGPGGGGRGGGGMQ